MLFEGTSGIMEYKKVYLMLHCGLNIPLKTHTKGIYLRRFCEFGQTFGVRLIIAPSYTFTILLDLK